MSPTIVRLHQTKQYQKLDQKTITYVCYSSWYSDSSFNFT